MFPLYAARHHRARYLVPSKHSPKLQKDFSTCRLCWWWQPRSRHALSVGRVYSESVIYNYNNNNNNFLFYEFYGRVRAVEVYTPDLPAVYSSVVRDNSRISTWPRYAMCSRSGNRQPLRLPSSGILWILDSYLDSYPILCITRLVRAVPCTVRI